MRNISLIGEIKRAFSVDNPPLKENVLYEGAYEGNPELESIKEFFGDRPWKDITPEDIFNFRPALSFFSKSALAYFAPAWMSCSLLDEDNVDTAIEDFAHTLERTNPSLWTDQQRRVICKWLAEFYGSDLTSSTGRFHEVGKSFGC